MICQRSQLLCRPRRLVMIIAVAVAVGFPPFVCLYSPFGWMTTITLLYLVVSFYVGICHLASP